MKHNITPRQQFIKRLVLQVNLSNSTRRRAGQPMITGEDWDWFTEIATDLGLSYNETATDAQWERAIKEVGKGIYIN